MSFTSGYPSQGLFVFLSDLSRPFRGSVFLSRTCLIGLSPTGNQHLTVTNRKSLYPRVTTITDKIYHQKSPYYFIRQLDLFLSLTCVSPNLYFSRVSTGVLRVRTYDRMDIGQNRSLTLPRITPFSLFCKSSVLRIRTSLSPYI